MEPPPRSLALDAHYCIMVRVPWPTEYKYASAIGCACWRAPLVSTPCRPRPATADPTQNRWPLRSLDRDEDMVVLQTNNEIKYPNRRLDRNHPIQVGFPAHGFAQVRARQIGPTKAGEAQLGFVELRFRQFRTSEVRRG